MPEHVDHVTVDEALAADCFYGECEHIDEDGMPDDFSTCPTFSLEVCVDCMEDAGYGRDPGLWEDSLRKWPHDPDRAITPTLDQIQTDAADSGLSVVVEEPSIFKPGLMSPQPSVPSTKEKG